MAREAKIQIFQGTTPKPTRVYLQALLAKLRGNYDRLVVPCAGRFTVPQVARAAGWAPERIIASEISLFSTVVGYVAAGRNLAELQISFGAELAWRLDQYKGGDRFAAAVLYAMKWAQLASGKNSYLKAQRDELDFQTDFYVEEFHRADRIDFTLVSRPEEAALASSPRPVTKIATGGWSILPPKYQITEKSVIQCHRVPKEVALYFRDLFAHKLGVTRSEVYYALALDGRLFAVCGIHRGDAQARRHTKNGLNINETFGFNASTQYARLNKLLMMCLTCTQFRDDLLRTNPNLAYVGDFGFATACIADVPEVKANRGVLKIVEKKRLSNGKYHLTYRTEFREGTYADQLAKWLARDSKVREAA